MQKNNHFLLEQRDGKLSLIDTREKNTRPLTIDFITGKYQHRRQFGGGRQQLIARAVGIKPNYSPTIIDATAGLAQDAFVLASLGCDVLMLERSPIIAALIADALQRAPNDKLKLLNQDAQTFLSQLDQKNYPDVIYLDPMYPHSTKSALNKIAMRYLREIVGDDQDAPELLTLALKIARKRVVVKRPRLAPYINTIKPSIVYPGKSSRFDVYLLSNQSS